MGGTSGDRAMMLAGPANCLLLCHLCHRWIESNRTESIAAGWLLGIGEDPRSAPAVIYRRGRVLLGIGYSREGAVLDDRPARPGATRVQW